MASSPASAGVPSSAPADASEYLIHVGGPYWVGSHSMVRAGGPSDISGAAVYSHKGFMRVGGSGGGFPVRRMAVAGHLLVGTTEDAYFILDTREEDAGGPPHPPDWLWALARADRDEWESKLREMGIQNAPLYATEADWHSALRDAGIETVPALVEPQAIAAGLPAPQSRPWDYAGGRGVLGLTDFNLGVLMLPLALPLSIPVGLVSPNRLVRIAFVLVLVGGVSAVSTLFHLAVGIMILSPFVFYFPCLWLSSLGVKARRRIAESRWKRGSKTSPPPTPV